MKMTYTQSDDPPVFEVNTVYADYSSGSSQVNYQGSIDEVTLSGATSLFTLSGQVNSDVRSTTNMDVYIGEDNVDFTDMTMSVDYTAQTSGTAEVSADLDMSAMTDDIMAWLKIQRVNMKVYDDANELIGDYDIPMAEIADLSAIL
jgi:hypothetical protein